MLANTLRECLQLGRLLQGSAAVVIGGYSNQLFHELVIFIANAKVIALLGGPAEAAEEPYLPQKTLFEIQHAFNQQRILLAYVSLLLDLHYFLFGASLQKLRAIRCFGVHLRSDCHQALHVSVVLLKLLSVVPSCVRAKRWDRNLAADSTLINYGGGFDASGR